MTLPIRRALPAVLSCATLVLFLTFSTAAVLMRLPREAEPASYPAPFLPYPRIERAAGAIQLLRGAPSLEAAVLRALNGRYLRAEVLGAAPSPGGLYPAPRIAALVSDFAGIGRDDDLRAWTKVRRNDGDDTTEGLPALIVWRMPDGRYLSLRELDLQRQDLATAPLGYTVDLCIGFAGLIVATSALGLRRLENKSLRMLAEAASAFDGQGRGLVVNGGASRDMGLLIGSVRAMQERVAMLLQERSFLVGAISHDMKTYLTRLRLRAETIADDNGRDRIVADLDGMTDLIETALAFARGTNRSQHLTTVDLADLAAVEAAERAAFGRDVSLSGDGPDNALVRGDPVALRRVLSNLIENAEKFGRGRVRIGVDAGLESCRVSIDDDGSGVSKSERAVIFSPFYSIGGLGKSPRGGSGLGLAIARQIVEAHGGTLAVEDGPLGGARFVVVLPAARSRDAAVAA